MAAVRRNTRGVATLLAEVVTAVNCDVMNSLQYCIHARGPSESKLLGSRAIRLVRTESMSTHCGE